MSSVRSVLIHRAGGKLSPSVEMMVLEAVKKEIEMTSNLQKISAVLLLASALPVWASHNDDTYPEPVYDDA